MTVKMTEAVGVVVVARCYGLAISVQQRRLAERRVRAAKRAEEEEAVQAALWLISEGFERGEVDLLTNAEVVALWRAR